MADTRPQMPPEACAAHALRGESAPQERWDGRGAAVRLPTLQSSCLLMVEQCATRQKKGGKGEEGEGEVEGEGEGGIAAEKNTN